MKIVAIDTSTEFCSVALWLDGELVSRARHAGPKHSEFLLPMLDELFTTTKTRLNEFFGIAFGAGPGSFTGLRIACGVTQGLALGANLPVVGVSTLLAIAEASGAARAVCCMDARMSEVYHAAYTREGDDWATIHEPGLYKPQSVPDIDGNDWIGCGNGFAVYEQALMNRYAGQVVGLQATLFPHAKEIARLAVPLFERGMGREAVNAVPIYVRDKVALRIDER